MIATFLPPSTSPIRFPSPIDTLSSRPRAVAVRRNVEPRNGAPHTRHDLNVRLPCVPVPVPGQVTEPASTSTGVEFEPPTSSAPPSDRSPTRRFTPDERPSGDEYRKAGRAPTIDTPKRNPSDRGKARHGADRTERTVGTPDPFGRPETRVRNRRGGFAVTPITGGTATPSGEADQRSREPLIRRSEPPQLPQTRDVGDFTRSMQSTHSYSSLSSSVLFGRITHTYGRIEFNLILEDLVVGIGILPFHVPNRPLSSPKRDTAGTRRASGSVVVSGSNNRKE